LGSADRDSGVSWAVLAGTCLPIIILAFVPAPGEVAVAYVDPNSVGPLYQFLFPAVVAVTSVIAGFRRALVRFWNRLRRAPTTAARAEPTTTDGEPNP
jgi:hypothetical protein